MDSDLKNVLDKIPDNRLEDAMKHLAMRYFKPDVERYAEKLAEDGDGRLAGWTDKDFKAVTKEFVEYLAGYQTEDVFYEIMFDRIDEHIRERDAKKLVGKMKM